MAIPSPGQVRSRQHHRARRIAAALRRDQSERREHAARARAEDPFDPELGRDRRGVERSGAPERQEREAARIDAAFDGDHPHRPDHLGVGDLDDAPRGLVGFDPELRGELRDGLLRCLAIERYASREPAVGAEVAEQQVGVGDRRLVTAIAVASGPGPRARRPRADPQCAAGVTPGDRPPAGADRVDVEHRQLDRATGELTRVGAADTSVLDHADVTGGAAHVEAERVAVAADAREHPGADGASCRAAEHAPGASACGLVGVDHPAGRLHHQRRRYAELAALIPEPAQVASEQRGEVGVEHGGSRSARTRGTAAVPLRRRRRACRAALLAAPWSATPRELGPDGRRAGTRPPTRAPVAAARRPPARSHRG